MNSALKAIIYLNLLLCCWCLPADEKSKTSTTTSKPSSTTLTPSTTSTTTAKTPEVPGSHEGIGSLRFGSDSSDSGIAHVIKHSKLFTEFVSFAVNPNRAMDTVYAVKDHLTTPTSLKNLTVVNGTLETSDPLKDLFLEMVKRNSQGLIVSFDYLNITAKSSEGINTFRKPVRMWGLIPDDGSKMTLYFLADYYNTATKDAETKSSAVEQLDDFEMWKNEKLASGEFTDDKLGDGTIGSLLGRK